MLRINETRATYAIRRAYDLMTKAIVPGSRKHLPPAPRLAVIPTDYLGISIIGAGVYERREIELLKALFQARSLQDTVFLDIGGNIGNHSVSLAGSFAEVVAFEPNPPIASLFKTNLLLSGTGNVRLHEVGLGREDTELRFSLLEAGNDGSGSFASGKGDIVLPVRHGDRYLAQHEPEIASGTKRIGFVKCDVEGFEADVFAGLRETFARHRPILTFESNRKPDGEKAWAELRAAGYDTLSCLRETGDDGSRPLQEMKRLVLGYSCWLEGIGGIPERRCNLVASFGPLEPIA
ncbi:FkbM family methyltransferase [Bosea sp. Tri-44]|uniref:FkbM family methyltransferase n=1 Tax=Bosea sp. Tri-44 TaxID=1972137 RepID=UPI0013E98309|nr:FkbM family methyltransferase [Bosea sp. Tri-44]